MRRAELSDLGDGSGDRRDPLTIHQEGSPGSQTGGVRYGPALKSDGGKARGPDGGNQGRSRAAEAVGGTLGIGPATEGGHGMSLVPPKRPFRERMPDQRWGRTLGKRTVAAVAIDAGPQEGAATEESVVVGNGLYLPGRIEGNGVSFLVDTGSGVSILAARTWRKWSRVEDELTRYWGRLCSVEGRAPGQSMTYRDSRNSGHRVELHSGGNLRQ